MFYPRIFLSLCGALMALGTSVFADTVLLKNGETVEGKVLSETETEVVLEVSMTASIKDERVIKKAEIKEIKKVPADEAAWAPLKGLALGTESREAAGEYTAAITRLTNFVTTFPKSAYAAEAQKTLTAFEEEKKRVEGGELKLDGKWLSKEEVEAERVQIDGKLLFRRMQHEVSAGQLTAALNTFDALDKRAGGSASFPDAVLLARQTVAALKPAVEQQKLALKARVEENKRRLENATGTDRKQLEIMHKQQAEKNDSELAAHERLGLKWLPLSPSTDRSLNALASKVTIEANYLNRYTVDKMKESLVLAEAAKTAIAEGNWGAAEDAYRKASSAWMKNDYVTRLQPQMSDIKTKANSARVAAEKAAKAEKEAKEFAEANKPKRKVAAGGATNPAGPAEVAAVDEEAEPKKSVLASPVFWICLLVVGTLAAVMMKGFKRERAPTVTFMDQQ